MKMVVEFHQANPCIIRACSIDRRKACISLLSNHVFKPLWSIPAHPIPSHIFDSLRSALMRLSDERSLHSSIHHYTAAQPVFGTKSFHCSQISFVFLNLLIGVCAEMPHSQRIAVCTDSIKKKICTSPDGLWTCLITFYSRFSHLTGVLAICDERRMRGIFTFINFTL